MHNQAATNKETDYLPLKLAEFALGIRTSSAAVERSFSIQLKLSTGQMLPK